MKLIIQLFLSLDGVLQAPGGKTEDPSNNFDLGGWVSPFADEEFGALVEKSFQTATHFLFSRLTYDLMAAHWPKIPDPESMKMNTCPKFVVSASMAREGKKGSWNTTTVLDGSDLRRQVEEVKKMEEEGEVQVHGSGSLARQLHDLGLVDEFRLFLMPIVLGKGKKLWGDGALPTSFEVAESKTTSKGLVYVSLKPKGGVVQEDVPPPEEFVGEGKRDRAEDDEGDAPVKKAKSY
ncbi:hypothetical protein HK097_009604 [Rhizophlyctis rosea]|uniref:2,5-diamino-6-ribosylamino-4(3H)-pyrimidinone 5'-phosphate reductase n=1 Tax=Rhizophlyctis rosea TaxID=64517 RepID=A0AAD5SKT0_9FUNG|nr:hypothetical protein HK097_009604 [Rhizophlyctis rosea]